MQNADAIVVLSAGISLTPGNSKIFELNVADRFLSGLKLYKAGKANKLIFTGGSNPFQPEIPLEGDILISESTFLEIDKDRLKTTTKVFNTKQEAKAIKKLFAKEKGFVRKKIILVTSAYHMQRAKRIFEREDIYVLPYPVDFKADYRSMKKKFLNPLNFIPSSSNLNNSSLSIREIIGRLIYNTWK